MLPNASQTCRLNWSLVTNDAANMRDLLLGLMSGVLFLFLRACEIVSKDYREGFKLSYASALRMSLRKISTRCGLIVSACCLIG